MSPPVRVATAGDVTSWLALTVEVEPLFGPMPGIQRVIERGIDRGSAFVTGVEGEMTGGMLLGGDDRDHRITWLAVAGTARGHGFGTALVRAALDRWPSGDIEVVTFTADTPGGGPARRLYERLGFVLVGSGPSGPEGSARDLYRLHR